MFKTLRRLHGQNLDHAGLNDLTEAFNTFMTRVRFFSVGRIRRTWSHSAVEFMKYRRRLPALVAPDSEYNQDDADRDESDSEYTPRTERGPRPVDIRRVYVSNVSSRVTTSQLASFFSKFGRVSSCQMPLSDKEFSAHCLGGTFPRKKSRGVAYVCFRSAEDANKAKSASTNELRFYDRVMVVSQAYPHQKKRHTIMIGDELVPTASQEDDQLSIQSETSDEPESPLFMTASSIEPPIYSLPDHVLRRIIRLLDLHERVRVERVCKKWLEQSFKCWVDMQTLDFSVEQFSPNGSRKPLQNHFLRPILRRCGRYVRSIHFAGVSNLLDDNSLQIVSKECSNLVQIDLTGVKIRWQAVKLFAEHLPNLEEFCFKDAVSLGEKAFWYLFRSCNNLRRVDLRGCRRLQGRCFRLQGLLLEQVWLDGCVRLDAQAIEEICLKSPNVSLLRLNECYKLTDESLSLISRCLGNSLQVLTLCGSSFARITPDGLLNLGRLDSLTEIRLDSNRSVTDAVIEALADGAPGLKIVSLAQAGLDDTITENGLLALAKCEQLTQVNLDYLSNVSDACVSALASERLCVLSVRRCVKLTDQGVMSLMGCPGLQEADLSGCLRVTNTSIRLLVSSFTKLHHSHSTVTLVVGGTACDPKSLRTDASRVVLDTNDYSNAVRRAMSNVLRISIEEAEGADGYSEDEMFSDDEFESLSAQRSFVLDVLEEDDLLKDEDPFEDWETKYGKGFGMIDSDLG